MGKRENREGTITRRKDGRWEARVTLPNSGKRRSFYGKTREEVRKKLNAAQSSIDAGIPLPSDRVSFGTRLSKWLDRKKLEVRNSTWKSYELAIRRHIAPALGRVPLSKLRPHHIQDLYSEMAKKGLSQSTIHVAHVVCNSVLKEAERFGLIPRNVAGLVDPPRPERTRRERKSLTVDQAKAFLAAAKGDRFYTLFLLAVYLGLRQGELLGLSWDDIDFPNARLQVRHQLSRIDGEYQLTRPKSRQSRRTLHLSGTVTNALAEHRARQSEEKLASIYWDDSWNLVFPNAYGRPMSVSNLRQRHFLPVLKKSGVPSITFHELRHTAASTMLTAGVGLKTVSETLGHSQISITADLYAHVSEQLSREASAKVDEIMKGSGA